MTRSVFSGCDYLSRFGSQHMVNRRKMKRPASRLSIYGLSIYGLMICLTLTGCSMPDGPELGEANTPTAREEPIREEPIREEPIREEPILNRPETTEPDITLNGPGQLLPISAIAQMRNEQIALEIAQTPEQQALGLMFRSALPDNRGMFFPLGNPRRARFWMKDVPVPLDMVFLRDSEIVFIAAEVPPCATLPCPSYGPETELVNQVIELRSGRAAEIGLQVGDIVVIEETTSNNL